MDVDELMSKARDAMTVKRVFGDPVEKDGVTIIPAATVTGGAGGGRGDDKKGQSGDGAGYGVRARPAGAYVIKNGEVSWRPAIDPNRVVAAAAAVVVVYLFTRARVKRARVKAAAQ
jgi:uncharacterized spore protein YtfJ